MKIKTVPGFLSTNHLTTSIGIGNNVLKENWRGQIIKFKADFFCSNLNMRISYLLALLVQIYFAVLVQRHEVMGRPAESQIWRREGQCSE